MTDASPKLDVIKVPNRYGALADVLREKIFSGEFPEGTALPAERDLVAQTGLSRSSVREALRVLEAEGLVRIKLGRYGGTVVEHQGRGVLGRLVDLFIKGRKIRFEAVLEARQALEPMLAYLAARERTEEQLLHLRNLTEALEKASSDKRGETAKLNVDWHLAVAAASNNELLATFMESMADACLRASVIEDHGSEALRGGMLRAHRGILEAIEAQDSEKAFRRMARHINAYASTLAGLAPREVSLG
ncbi:GntR family transcriptional repressor for pyruvate dehydrogenase complex [Paraburkholderia sp. UCT70]|uniref:FadR/GntR family transcriptional regulator n=1 Tax=Paraburkholderia sp. UCT70 TaxID=2991068 RepID=UPI003D213474